MVIGSFVKVLNFVIEAFASFSKSFVFLVFIFVFFETYRIS